MENNRTIFLRQQVYATLFSLANKIQVKGDQNLEAFTSRQLMMLISILHLPDGFASINNIARKMGTTKQSIKQLVNIVEKKGYIMTVPSKNDKRSVNIVITPSGNQALYRDAIRGTEFFDTLFYELTSEELDTLWTLLKKLYRFDGVEQDGFEETVEYNPLEKDKQNNEIADTTFSRLI
ncbi:MAG: MarR family transcriptional regulator [Leptolinea sp.]|nr:MarR family transcriptional regulator [Leptolinea sp.]